MPCLTKFSAQARDFYLAALSKLKHPEAFTIEDLTEVMFLIPSRHSDKHGKRSRIPTRTELGIQIHSLPGITPLGSKIDGWGRQVRQYCWKGRA